MNRITWIAFFFFWATAASAQYFQYSQYNFSEQRINPAIVASSDYASLGLLYRNQAAGGNINLKSSLFSAAYPLMSHKTGMRWSGVGVSLMDDRSGGIFSTQEMSLSYAVNIFLSRFQSLSLGFKGLYQRRNVNLDGLYTGSQYIPDRGFDGSIANGENIQFLRSNYLTFSSGLYWQQTNRDGERVAYWSVSFFDFNKPEDSFLGIQTHLNSTFIAGGAVRVYDSRELAFSPEVLLTHNASNTVVNLGGITTYRLNPRPKQVSDRIDVITKYVIGRSGIVGLQLHRENFSIGCSYDFPVLRRNFGNLGAFEVGVVLRKLVAPKIRKKQVAKKKTPEVQKREAKPVTQTAPRKPAGVKPPVTTKDSTAIAQKKKPDLKTTLQHKQDSVVASAEAGHPRYQPLVIEKIMLHFNFEFNSSELDETSKRYLEDLATALQENGHLRIRLTGHTDNIGSAKFNQRLSLFRAETIKEYLVEKGIDPLRIDTEGKGLTEPLNENKTEDDRRKNRRVELTILYEE
jgi:type IX secretion system PorP/SprF family membrane protein